MMRRKIQYFNILTFLFLSTFLIKGQEVRPIFENHTIKKFLFENETKKLKSAKQINQTDTALFDDFSDITVFPNPLRWLDNCAFINSTFGIDPITYGVATLDATDGTGNVYNVSDKPTLCDSLTSIPLNLRKGTTYYLSFFYQPQGIGEAPESGDSLIVEFYHVSSGKWLHMWGKPGSNSYEFAQQILAVPDSFNQPGFKFRFRNYASFSADELKGGKGALSNFDEWHIDYVRFNNNPITDHEKVYDISIINNPASSLTTYQSIPWSHVDNAVYHDLRHIMPIAIRINDKSPLDTTVENSTPADRGMYIKNMNTGEFLLPLEPQSSGENLAFNSINWRYDIFTSPLKYDANEEVGKFEIGIAVMGTNFTNNQYTGNDTIKRIETYSHHYAYDDGTAEMGFGLSGESISGSLLVQKFNLFKGDSLRYIDIYFNKVKDDANEDNSFQLCVWNSINGEPGDLLYPKNIDDVYLKSDSLKLFAFRHYELKPAIFVSDEIFVGIIQRTNDFINIGYDLNTSNRDKIFYNTTGEWFSVDSESQSIPAGSLMIRPVFSSAPLNFAGVKQNLNHKLSIYPNPASDYLQFSNDNLLSGYYKVKIIDALGNIVSSELLDDKYIDISFLQPGFYILEIVNSEGKIFTGKFSKT